MVTPEPVIVRIRHGDAAVRSPIHAVIVVALLSALTTALTGCAWLLGFEDGRAEGERLGAAVAELPGVESIETSGSEQNPTMQASALVDVQMSVDASPSDLEGVVLGWNAAAFEQDDKNIRRVLYIEYPTISCAMQVRYGTHVQRLKDTARFLPALCASVEGGRVRIEDRWYSRSVVVSEPDAPVDVGQLRTLPGAIIDLATTDYDNWTIDGIHYAWHEHGQ